jgi:tRNA dimethylallyltransferase
MIVAERTGAEIVSVDSVQVYRGMDIGTAKPSLEERARVSHHMIDLVDPAQPFSVAEFQATGRRAMREIQERGRPVLIVGGSGLHFRSLVDPLDFPPTDEEIRDQVESLASEDAVAELLEADPGAIELVDMENPRRVVRAVEILRITGLTPSQRATTPEAAAVRAYEAHIPVSAVGIDPGDLLGGRVVRRFDRMLEAGMLYEVAGLRGRLGPTAATAVGYREMMRVVAGEWDHEMGRRRSIDATTSLARRQRTYHRRDPRIAGLEWQDGPAALAAAAVARLEEAGWTS